MGGTNRAHKIGCKSFDRPEKRPDGLFTVGGQEEKNIRTKPAGESPMY